MSTVVGLTCLSQLVSSLDNVARLSLRRLSHREKVEKLRCAFKMVGTVSERVPDFDLPLYVVEFSIEILEYFPAFFFAESTSTNRLDLV